MRHVLSLSRLTATPKEFRGLRQDLEKIITYAEKLETYNTPQSNESIPDISADEGSLRKDIKIEFSDRNSLFSNTTEKQGGYILVPKTVE